MKTKTDRLVEILNTKRLDADEQIRANVDIIRVNLDNFMKKYDTRHLEGVPTLVARIARAVGRLEVIKLTMYFMGESNENK